GRGRPASSASSCMMRAETSAKRLASCHGSAVPSTGREAWLEWAASLGRSASTPLVSAPQKPRIAPAARATSVRGRLDMRKDLLFEVRRGGKDGRESVTLITGAPSGPWVLADEPRMTGLAPAVRVRGPGRRLARKRQ